jgi:hypothetical protein
MDEISREILWNIPAFMKYAMYLSLMIASAIFIIGMQRKISYIKGSSSLKTLLPQKLNWSALANTVFFQGKVPRDTYVAVFHSLIFYGF